MPHPLIRLAQSAYLTWRPRPDRPEEGDEQSAFVFDQCPGVAILLGGNASGKTSAAAYKAARFLLSTPPPRPACPFVLVAPTYEQTCGVLWGEKLNHRGFLPYTVIDYNKISWLDRKRGYPRAVPLKPAPNGYNWVIELRSAEQSAMSYTASSIGGFWISELCDEMLIYELLRGCRDYNFPGSRFLEATPTDPRYVQWLERITTNTPPGWRIYKLNTELNTNLAPGWLESFRAMLPPDLLATRLRGELPRWRGAIFPELSRRHIISQDFAPPVGVRSFLGIDWGYSHDHPFAAIAAWRDGGGTWTVYREWLGTDEPKLPRAYLEEFVPLRPEIVYADPSRPDLLAEAQLLGLPAYPAQNSVLMGIHVLKSLLHADKLRIAEHCTKLLSQLRTYRWADTSGPPRPVKGDDDLVDALRYLVASAPSGEVAPPIRLSTPRAWAGRR